jgi:hypothetical protein
MDAASTVVILEAVIKGLTGNFGGVLISMAATGIMFYLYRQKDVSERNAIKEMNQVSTAAFVERLDQAEKRISDLQKHVEICNEQNKVFFGALFKGIKGVDFHGGHHDTTS